MLRVRGMEAGLVVGMLLVTACGGRSSSEVDGAVGAVEARGAAVQPPASAEGGGTPAPAGPYDAWGAREHLLGEVPAEFGGLFYEQPGHLVVLAVPDGDAEVVAALEAFDQGRGATTPPFRVEEATFSLRRLEDLKAELLGHPTLFVGPESVVKSVWVDDEANALAVGLGQVTPANQATVLQELGVDESAVEFYQQDVVPIATGP